MSSKPAEPPADHSVALPTPSVARVNDQPRRHSWLLRAVVWVLVISCGAAGWHYQEKWLPHVKPILERFSPPKPTKPPPRIVTVGTGKVGQRHVDIYLNALGTVTAFRTVTVRSRVEGELREFVVAEGQKVKEGDVLANIETRPFEAPLKQAEGQLAKDQATLAAAKLTLERSLKLLESNAIAPQEVEQERSLVEQAEGAVKTDLAVIDNARLQLNYCRITAPISGRIGLRYVDVGNIIRANDTNGLLVITQLQPISVIFTIPQDDIARVLRRSKGDQQLNVDAYDRDFRTKLATGSLLAIDNQVDPATGTLRLKAVFENEDELLFPNQFVNVKLLVDSIADAIVAPSAAVQRGPRSEFVYVLQPDETVALREVTTGTVSGTETVITSGLTPGETVVTDGLDKLQSGSKVATRDSKKKGDKPVSDKDDKSRPSKGVDDKPTTESKPS